MSWGQWTTGTDSSGSIEEAHTCTVAWFADAPDVQQLLAAEDYADLLTGVEDIVSYADSIVSTINPAISID